MLLIKGEFHPQAPGVCQEMLGEGEHALYIELLLGGCAQLNLSQGKLLPQLVALTFVRLPVN